MPCGIAWAGVGTTVGCGGRLGIEDDAPPVDEVAGGAWPGVGGDCAQIVARHKVRIALISEHDRQANMGKARPEVDLKLAIDSLEAQLDCIRGDAE